MDPEEGQDLSGSDGTQGQSSSDGGTGFNPNWSGIMEMIPEERHSDAQRILSEWDQNYSKVQSSYKPYEQYASAGVEPDEIDFALNLANAVSTQPEEVLQILQAYVEQEGNGQMDTEQFEGGSGDQGQSPDGSSFDLSSHPDFQRYQQAVDAMAQIMQQQREQQQEQEEDARLEQELSQLKEQHGEFDDNFVIAQMLNGMEPEDAVKAYHSLVENIQSKQRPPGPRVLGTSGQIPNQDIDPKKLSSSDRRNYVAQLLSNHNAERG